MHASCMTFSSSRCSRSHSLRSSPRRSPARVFAFQVTMQTPQGTKKCAVDAGKSLLEGALAAGIEVPHLCRTGTCGACAAKVLSGDVQRDDLLLDEQQQAAGYVLLCTTTPASDVELLTEQETEMHTLPYGL